MAKAKATKQTDTPARHNQAGNGPVKEKLANKAEAMRRALAKLGNKAMPAEIQHFIKTHFGVDMTTKVISVYKSQLTKKKTKQGRAGRKPDRLGATAEPAPTPAAHGGVTFQDLRKVKEISDRLGLARMREVVELVAD